MLNAISRLKPCMIGLALVISGAPVSAADQPAAISKHIAKILAATDGATEQTAYKVSSVHEEYEIVAALKLTPKIQSLVVKKKPFDVIEAADETGATRKIWFDISSFYPEF
ncbi:MAG: DUF4919 domain-containing protein [Sphingomicrobium sp.]